MLAVIFSSNATNDVNGPAKKVSISGAGATFPLPFYNLAFKTYQDKTGNSNITDSIDQSIIKYPALPWTKYRQIHICMNQYYHKHCYNT